MHPCGVMAGRTQTSAAMHAAYCPAVPHAQPGSLIPHHLCGWRLLRQKAAGGRRLLRRRGRGCRGSRLHIAAGAALGGCRQAQPLRTRLPAGVGPAPIGQVLRARVFGGRQRVADAPLVAVWVAQHALIGAVIVAPPRRAALRKRLGAQAGAAAAQRCAGQGGGRGVVGRRGGEGTTSKAARWQSGGGAVGAVLGRHGDTGGPSSWHRRGSTTLTWRSGGRERAARAGGGLNGLAGPARGRPPASRLRERSCGHAERGFGACGASGGWALGASRGGLRYAGSSSRQRSTMVAGRVGNVGRAPAPHLAAPQQAAVLQSS